VYDVIVIGAGIAGATFACKVSKFAKTLLIEASEEKNLPITTNVYAEHNKRFLYEVDYSDKSIFPLFHEKKNYMGAEEDGLVYGEEFGAPFGLVSHTEKLVKKLLQMSQENGGELRFSEKVSKIVKHGDHLEVINNKGESYQTKLAVLATGSTGFELQRSFGFATPDRYLGIYTHLGGDLNKIEEQMVQNYVFHINPKISTNGPFFLVKGEGRVNIGYLGNSKQSSEELISKLNRIIDNYKRIQPYVKGLKRLSKPVIRYISKHPINNFSLDRMMVLGEAAGLVTAFFYEGMLSGVCSADIAASTIKPLIENNSNFSQSELQGYDRELHRILIDSYNQNGVGSEYLFYNANTYIKVLWNTYVKLINKDKQLRREIWEAYRMHDLENYDIKGTKRAGRQLFAMLPALTKVALGGKFIRAAFK